MKNLFLIVIVLFIVAIGIVWLLYKSSKKPIKGNGVSILYPLMIYIFVVALGMSQAFVNRSGTLTLPPFTTIDICGAVLLGIFISIPMVWTTDYETRDDGKIYKKENKTFVYVVIGLIILRFILRTYLSSFVSPLILLLLLLIMATTYFTIWRISIFIKFRRLLKNNI